MEVLNNRYLPMLFLTWTDCNTWISRLQPAFNDISLKSMNFYVDVRLGREFQNRIVVSGDVVYSAMFEEL